MIFEYWGWSVKRGHVKGTLRAKDSKEALEVGREKKLLGSGEIFVRPKRKKK